MTLVDEVEVIYQFRGVKTSSEKVSCFKNAGRIQTPNAERIGVIIKRQLTLFHNIGLYHTGVLPPKEPPPSFLMNSTLFFRNKEMECFCLKCLPVHPYKCGRGASNPTFSGFSGSGSAGECGVQKILHLCTWKMLARVHKTFSNFPVLVSAGKWGK